MLKSSVYIVGPSCTGKTTLCQAFARHMGLDKNRVVSEVARNVMQSHGFTRADVGRLEMQKTILDATLERYKEIKQTAPQVSMIYDRSVIDPVVYAILTAKNTEDMALRKKGLMSTEGFHSALEDYRRSTVILLKPVREWIVDDGVRSIEDTDYCFEVFRKILEECRVIYRVMGSEVKSLEDRVASLAVWTKPPNVF